MLRSRNCSGNQNKKSLAAKFLFECSEKLNIKPLTVACAAQFFHRFFAEVESNNSEYDEFVSEVNQPDRPDLT